MQLLTDFDPLSFIATQYGHDTVIAELAKNKANLNVENINEGILACIAAQNGHAQIITELAKHQVNLDLVINGQTPAS